MQSTDQQSTLESLQEFPLRMAGGGHFSRVRSYLREAEYSEASVCRVLGISELRSFPELDSREVQLRCDEPPRISVLIKLFFLMLPVPAQEVESLLPPAVLDSLQALDLLRPHFEAGHSVNSYICPVWLYPVADFLIASDQSNDSGQAVFPALGELTFRFLKLLETAAGSTVLDLCSGSGIAGIKLSLNSGRVVASDISQRAVHFAQFNAVLNGRANVRVVQSDLYSALGDETFGLIVAHPPYVPSLSNRVVWRDGGETGEQAIRRIVEGLVRHLRPGGTFLSACAGFDTQERRFEERVRDWLGEGQAEFDIIFAVRRETSPRRLALDLTEVSPDLGAKDIRLLEETFLGLRASQHVNGAIYLFRCPENSWQERQPLTLRTRWSPISDIGCFAWMRHWTRCQSRTDFRLVLKQLKPRISPQLQVQVTHVVRKGVLVPSEFILASGKPFLAETRVEPEMVKILEEFNGCRTLEELFELGRAGSLVPEGLSLGDFLDFGAKMMERGYLEIDVGSLECSV